MQLFLWSYAGTDGKPDRLAQSVNYGKELAKHPKVLRGQLAVMAWAKWFFGATTDQQVVIERDRYGIWIKVMPGSKQWPTLSDGQPDPKPLLFKASWSHTGETAAILLWSGRVKQPKLAPNFSLDLEPLERMFFPDTLARVLNDDECRKIRLYFNQPEYEIRFWTAKEALYKAGQSNKGLRNGATIEILATETDQGVATIHQFRRTSDSYKANLYWHKVNNFGVMVAILHAMPIGESVYLDMPLFAKPAKK